MSYLSTYPRAAGVICEFDPFHNGHARLLRAMREEVGKDGCVICLMSGRFLQRGGPATADPYLRAHAALHGGADLVLELPFPWSASGSETFAAAGVSILQRLRVGTLAFGSECGDPALLTAAAEVLAAPDFPAKCAARTREGLGATAALEQLLRDALTDPPLPQGFPSSNDLLGMQYLRAISASGIAMHPLILQRVGQGFREQQLLTNASAPSATALRSLMREAAEDPDVLAVMLEGTMPSASLAIWLDAIRAGAAPAREETLYPFLHAFFRLADPDRLSELAELSGGLSHRLVRAALDAATPDDFLNAIRSRLYTDARLRRAMLFGSLEVTDEDLHASPTFTTLLAADRRGCAFLKEHRAFLRTEEGRAYGIPVVSRPAHAPTCRQTDLSRRADALFTLCLPRPEGAGSCLRRTANILNQ